MIMLRIYGSMAEEKPVQFGTEKVREWLESGAGNGWEESGGSIFAAAPLTIVLKEDGDCPEEGYRLCRENNGFCLSASDPAGMMYGLMDLGRELVHKKGRIEKIRDRSVAPYVKKRGIKFNIPLDARTPSYSDASDSAFETIPDVWDFGFWQEYLDAMAEYHYNVLTLWSLSPFPSMVRIPEYPLAALDDVMRSMIVPRPEMSGWNMYTEDMKKGLYPVKRLSMDEKMDFWKRVMEYAADRCIEVYVFTWNLFLYGTEESPYGLTADQHNPVTKDYVYHAVKALIETYPLLAGIGVTAGEHMAGDGTDIEFIRETYGRAVEDCLKRHPKRKFRFIHRMQYAGFHDIEEKFCDFPGIFEISFKYSQAHMHSSVKPQFFSEFIKMHETEKKFWFTLRDDDYYMFRWGDPDYARKYLENMPVDRLTGFCLGADGFTWGRDYMDRLDRTHPLYIRKMWYKMMVWGQLSYDICREDEFFTEELECVYEVDGKRLSAVWAAASRIFCTFHLVHWHDYDFQWYPEGCCSFEHPPVSKLEFADINEFIRCESMPGSGCISVREYAECFVSGRNPDAVTPVDAAETIRKHSEFVLKEVALLEKGCKMEGGLYRLLMDLKALAYLGNYYSDKLKAAVHLCTYRLSPDRGQDKRAAVSLLEDCSCHWKTYSSIVKQYYKPQRLTRLCSYVDLEVFNRWTELDIELAENL
ncbi:putative uncharacterized protein [Hungatella hathewayi CAG:224]|nr:putative uncharacterized protein [Hungatella hathewayi CAG:224]